MGFLLIHKAERSKTVREGKIAFIKGGPIGSTAMIALTSERQLRFNRTAQLENG